MTIEEILAENEKIMARHDEIMKLSKEEFLSESVQKELRYIHNRALYLVRQWPKEGEGS